VTQEPQNLEELLAWQRQVALMELDGTVTRAFHRLDADRQRAVVGAIVGEAAVHGPDGVQIRRVAERAGVSVGSLYQYFGTRDGMVAAAIEVAVGYLTGTLDEAAPYMAQMPLRDGLLAYLTVGTEWSSGNADLLRLFGRAAYGGIAEHTDVAASVVRPVAESMRGVLRALLVGAAERGELRAGVDVETALRLVHVVTVAVGDAQLIGYLDDYYLLFDAENTPESVVPQMVDLLVRAIGADGTDDAGGARA
jgi:AcrR family transcriptional regulator